MRTHTGIRPGGILLAMCSDGGGVNHPCPWPLAALISGERWSRTRSISNAAGNDTSPALPGPRPRKGSTAQPLHYCLPLHTVQYGCHTFYHGSDRKKGFLLPLSRFSASLRKSSRKRRLEAAWWLLSEITSAGAELLHYHSEPLCLCPCHTDTRARSTAAHRRPHANTRAVAQTQSRLLCTGTR